MTYRDEVPPSPGSYLAKVREALAGRDLTLVFEPGRSIVAKAAVTLYTVGTIKTIDSVRTYVAVDGGMSDNPRPVLYGSGYESFLPRAVEALRPLTARLVGKHCESGDVLISEASVPADLRVGDVLAQGHDVVFQMPFVHEGIRGIADFLERADAFRSVAVDLDDVVAVLALDRPDDVARVEIGRASCRERV